jgi:hypothetical protein
VTEALTFHRGRCCCLFSVFVVPEGESSPLPVHYFKREEERFRDFSLLLIQSYYFMCTQCTWVRALSAHTPHPLCALSSRTPSTYVH